MQSPRRALLTVAVAVALLAVGQAALPALAADPVAIGSASDGSGAGRISIAIDRPAGTSAGQTMLASIVISDDDPAYTAPAGWTLVRQDSMKDMLRQAIYVKVAGSSEPASYTWTVPSARRIAGGITTFDGIDATHPVDAVNGATTSASTSVTAPAITTTMPNTILVELAAVASDGTLTAPGGMTEGWEAAAPGASTRKNTRGAVASLSYALQASAGSTGGRTATVSTAGRGIGVLLALRPVPAPDTSPPKTTIASGPAQTTTNAFATFTFSAGEPATFQCQLDGAAAEACTSPKTYVNLTAGDHTFAVWGTDTSGNVEATPATRSWTLSPDSGDPVINAAGDIAYCGNNNDEATAQLLDNMPGTVVTLGDAVYDSGTATEFANCYNPTWGRFKARTTPAPGNHEYVTSGASGYFNYFGSAAGDPTQGWYDYRLGAWHVIVLNSNCAKVGGCGAGSPEEQWLRNVLATSEAECTIAVWHHPRFSSGTTHGSNTEMGAFWQALYDYGADVVLNGHEHLYERFGMQAPDGTADAVYGLREITSGTGGRSSYAFGGTPLPNSDVRGRPYGVLKMILRDTSYSWEFTPVAGQTFTDSGSSSCHGAPGTPPVLPPPPPPPPPPSGDGIGVVGSIQDGASVSRATIGLARPSGTAAGDVLVASVATNADASILASDPGWTLLRNDLISGGLRQAVYVRAVTSTDPTMYQWTIPEGARRITGGITAYRGVNTVQPVDVYDATMNGSGTAVSAPSITTTVANAMLVQVVGVNAEGTLTPPGGMAEAWEASSPNSSSTRDVLGSSSYAVQAVAGPTGAKVATASLPGASIGVLLALRPA